MNIVMLANADSIWTIEYIKNVLFDDNVILISHSNNLFVEEYNKLNVKVYTFGCDIKNRIKRIYNEKKKIRSIKNEIGKISIIQYNYIDWSILIKTQNLWKKARYRILTFWGSDILRASRKMLFVYKKYLKESSIINMLTHNMLEKFHEVYGNAFDSKLTCFDFGCPMYDEIDNVIQTMSKEECKKYCGFDSEKIVVQIGYNNRVEQQHIEIINSINNIQRDVLNKCVFVCHLSYGGTNKDYWDRVESELKRANINYKLIMKFLNRKETAIFRHASDLFLYGQTTDSLSASFVEYLYAGCRVTKPRWLKFDELDNQNIEYIEYSHFDELNSILTDFVNDYDEYIKEDNIRNRILLREMNSWEVLAPFWKKIYSLDERKQ